MDKNVSKEQVLKEWIKKHEELKPYVLNVLKNDENFEKLGNSKFEQSIKAATKILKEFMKVYIEQEDNTLPITYNKFSDGTRSYFKVFARGVISTTDLFTEMLKIYFPELENLRITHANHTHVIKNQELSDSEIKDIVEKLGKVAVNGNIDLLFSGEHDDYLRYLSRVLNNKNISFDEFIMKYTMLDYTRCYSVDIMVATKQMIQDYYQEMNTMVGIKRKDNYLYSKITAGQRFTNKHTMKEYLKLLGLNSDNKDYSKNVLTEDEIEIKEANLIYNLENTYPDRIIKTNFSKLYKNINKMSDYIAKRKGFDNANDYLKSLGFLKEVSYESKGGCRIFLSENDIVAYGFLDDYDGSLDLEEWLEERFGMKLVNPLIRDSNNKAVGIANIYKKLSAEGKDSVSNSERKRKSRENTERFADPDDAIQKQM